MKLIQTQVQKLSQQQLQSVEMLQLSTLELEAYVRELALDNPLVEPEESFSVPENLPENELLCKLRWLEENDRQNRFYQHVGKEELDPLSLVGTEGGLEETLFRFLSRQIFRLNLSEDTAQIVRYLAACLDDNGYLRVPLEELSHNIGIPLSKLEECRSILYSLEPAGVGAKDLSQCLALQLNRIQVDGPPLSIVQNYLDLLAKRHYRAIAAQLGISVEEVEAAERTIQELDPRPGAVFQRAEQVQYILPDVFVTEESGRFVARTRRGERPIFHVNRYYLDLLSKSDDREVKEYLSSKLRQAENVLWAIGQRESTLQRCSQVIADCQSEFFRLGPRALLPLRMADVAQKLDVHESTISRTVREKYLQCVHGVYPMSFFFSRPATAEGTEGGLGGTAARTLLRHLIDTEDKAHPQSDQKLCEQMARENCPISRRTVAKYREEMNIPGASGRKRS
ncbi:MAG: RNA polymerase factor sigma-54 [Lawsonibacter sp.]